jgi:hypothetical protein
MKPNKIIASIDLAISINEKNLNRTNEALSTLFIERFKWHMKAKFKYELSKRYLNIARNKWKEGNEQGIEYLKNFIVQVEEALINGTGTNSSELSCELSSVCEIWTQETQREIRKLYLSYIE